MNHEVGYVYHGLSRISISGITAGFKVCQRESHVVSRSAIAILINYLGT